MFRVLNKVNYPIARTITGEIRPFNIGVRLLKSMTINKGNIIDYGKPKELIQKHGRKNMEEVFLKLTREKYEF